MPDIILPYEPIVITDTTDLPRDEWLAYRKTGIGGSDVAAILGISPFGTARDIYYDKLSIASFYDDEALISAAFWSVPVIFQANW